MFGPSVDVVDVTSRLQDGVMVVEVTGEADLGNADELSDALGRHVDADRPVAVDLSGMAFLDLRALRAVLATTGTGPQRGFVVPAGCPVDRVIVAGGFAGSLPIHRTLESAIASLAKDEPG